MTKNYVLHLQEKRRPSYPGHHLDLDQIFKESLRLNKVLLK